MAGLFSVQKQIFLYTRTDALDRLSMCLGQTITRQEVADMMKVAGLEHITFSAHAPFWCAVGFRRS